MHRTLVDLVSILTKEEFERVYFYSYQVYGIFRQNLPKNDGIFCVEKYKSYIIDQRRLVTKEASLGGMAIKINTFQRDEM